MRDQNGSVTHQETIKTRMNTVKHRQSNCDRWNIDLRRTPWSFLTAVVAVLLMTALIHYTHADASIVNIPPLYLLAVQAVAVLAGSRAAVIASVGSFLAFDWFFVDPRFQFTVRDPFEFVALCVFLVSAILVGQLTILFQTRASEARAREMAATALAKASWTVASDLNRDSALHKLLEQIFSIQAVEHAEILLPASPDECECVCTHARAKTECTKPESFRKAVSFVRETRQSIGWDDSPHWQKALETGDAWHSVYMPVLAEGKLLCILFFQLHDIADLSNDDRQVITSLMNHLAVVLQRDQLLEAQAKAQGLAEANRLKTSLLQMVSHDFRSPLASIKASVSSLLAEEGSPVDKPTQAGLLQAIEQETDRLNRMVGNLLDLSRLEANAWQPKRELCSLSELIGAALDSFGEQDNRRIEVELETGMEEVVVDFSQMVQVLKNLIENALKYSPSSKMIELKATTDSGGILLELSDSGPGLQPGEIERVFEPFYRGKQHQESSLPGVGMGLAVCKGLIEAHGGNLTAYNRETGGAIFCVRLPHFTVTANESSGN